MNQLTKNLKIDYYFLGILLLIVGFVIFKIPHLSLPFYWDEAWPFSHAVFKMFEHGPSLMPDAIPTEISRGHPLLFHFLASVWMKIFGTSLIANNVFPLFLSVLLILSIYFFAKKLLSAETGLIASIVFCLQAVFLAQSSFLLLEVLLALFAIWVIYFYLNKQKILYIIFASLLMMTKESGITLVATLVFWEIIRVLFIKSDKTISAKAFIINLIVLIVPVFLVAIYFIVQKIIHGWYFFPLHVDFMSFEFGVIKNKFLIILNFIFFAQGRYIITLLILLSLVVKLFISKRAFAEGKWEVLSILLLFILAFKAFSSLNFLSNRYLLITLPPLMLIFSHLLITAFKQSKVVIYAGLIIAGVILVVFNTKKLNNHDDNLGYIDQVKVHQQMVNYCEQQNLYDSTILTHFLMFVNLSSPYAGYLSDTNHKFNSIVNERGFSNDVDYCVFSAIEYFPVFDSIKTEADMELIKRFEKNIAWVELYKVKPTKVIIDTSQQAIFNKRVKYFQNRIRSDRNWLKMVKEKAEKREIPLDSMIKLDAIYMVKQEMEK